MQPAVLAVVHACSSLGFASTGMAVIMVWGILWSRIFSRLNLLHTLCCVSTPLSGCVVVFLVWLALSQPVKLLSAFLQMFKYSPTLLRLQKARAKAIFQLPCFITSTLFEANSNFFSSIDFIPCSFSPPHLKYLYASVVIILKNTFHGKYIIMTPMSFRSMRDDGTV